ncbi:MAG: D-2-hydroxyacid dehydrogenase [Candidatus Faecousia sp.]|nr:D-2-hydroxyacid dehydrogenase [Bacillota bacterium]MDY4220504.1 D-2-hydroxyacid dehydrogenase [Candidatus Faecousia sp.]
MKKILVTDGMDKGALASLRSAGFEVVEQFYAPEELGAALREVDCVVVRSATKVRQNHMDEALTTGRLKLIIRGGVGVDNIDVAYAEAHGIAVRNTPNASSHSVAELAVAHMFSCARFISVAGATMREGKWEKKAYGKGIELRGKTLGIVGYGRIGACLGDIAQALGMKVLAYRRHPQPELESPTLRFTTLDELLASSDFVSLHTPAIPGKPLMDRENIAKMKDGAVLINTSRGANVDEEALLEALNTGKLRAAGLDVWAQEPTKNEALYTHPRVSCTPHIGAATAEAQARVGSEVVGIIRDFFA